MQRLGSEAECEVHRSFGSSERKNTKRLLPNTGRARNTV